MENKELTLEEKEFLKLFELGRYNTDESLEDFFELKECLTKVDEEIGESRRWTTPIYEYYKVGDRYFCFNWARGNTEYQEKEFYEIIEMEPPREVIKIVYEWDIKEK